jgi:hypothetical protein
VLHLHPPRNRNTPDNLLLLIDLLIDVNQTMIWIQICQDGDEIMKVLSNIGET